VCWRCFSQSSCSRPPALGDPVPVLLGLASWNPTAESVTQFLARRLREDFALSWPVARGLATRPRVARDGSRSGWFTMPILDGLDEVASSWQAQALKEVERFGAGDRPVVLTCRRREFMRAETSAGVFARAAVVEMQPVQLDDVVEFLKDPSPRRERLWEPVFARLREAPQGVLAVTLSSPLMAGLTKDAFVVNDPGHLVGPSTRSEVEDLLVDRYVQAVYDPSPAAGGARRKLRRYDPELARCWLGTLAYLGYRDGTRDLRWWRLPWGEMVAPPGRLKALHATRLVAVAAVTTTLVVSAWLPWSSAIFAGIFTGGVLGNVADDGFRAVFAHEFQPYPSELDRTRRRTKRIAPHLACGALLGVSASLIAGAAVSGVAAGVMAGLVCGAFSAVVPSLRTWPTASPKGTLRANHVLALAASGRQGLIAAAVFGVASYGRSDSVRWTLAAVGVFVAAGALGGEATWLGFRLSQLYAAAPLRRGEDRLLPRAVVAFLEDGARAERAVIRVNGTAWQFRHAVIEDHLLRHGRVAMLRRHAAGDKVAAERLADLLWGQGDLAGAISILHPLAAEGGRVAGWRLVELFRRQGDLDMVASMLRSLVAEANLVGGDATAARELAALLRDRGDVEELGVRADAGDLAAARELADLLGERGDVQELRRRAGDGDGLAGETLIQQLQEGGDVEDLRRCAAAGDRFASMALVGLLVEQGELDQAVSILRPCAEAGDGHAAGLWANLLRLRGDVDGAVAVLRPFAESGDVAAARRLTDLLRERGELGAAVEVMLPFADAGDWSSQVRLGDLLHELGDVNELGRRADAGDQYAAGILAELLGKRDDIEELQRRADADADDGHAAVQLAELLGKRGDIEELQRRAEDGDWFASQKLAESLAEQLGERGDLDQLRRRADDGDGFAARRLAKLLAARGDTDEALSIVRRRADADADILARQLLADVLYKRGDVDELRRRADRDGYANVRLIQLLAERGDLEDLQRRAEAGDPYLARTLEHLLKRWEEVLDDLQHEQPDDGTNDE
jgi:hypothetical protein